MCLGRTNNRKINRLHERCLHIIYNGQRSLFSELLEMDGSVSIHMRNIQSLVIEMFRVSGNIWPPIVNDIFKQKLVKSVYHRCEIISFLGPKIWDVANK